MFMIRVNFIVKQVETAENCQQRLARLSTFWPVVPDVYDRPQAQLRLLMHHYFAALRAKYTPLLLFAGMSTDLRLYLEHRWRTQYLA